MTCSSKARTSIRIRSSAPTGKFLAWIQWNHPEHAVGRHRALGRGDQSRRLDRLARDRSPAAPRSRFSSPSGRRTARCFSYRIAPAGGISIDGALRLRSEQEAARATRSIRWRRSSASRSGRSAWSRMRLPTRIASRRRIPRVGDGSWRSSIPTNAASRRSICRWSRWSRSGPQKAQKAQPSISLAVRRLKPCAIYRYSAGGHLRVLRSSATDPIPREWISVAEAVTYKVGDRDVHAFYYPPTNPDVTAPADNVSAADRRHARRPDRRDARRARSEGPVLDQPRLCGARRELQRQHRLRAAVSRSPERSVGHRRRRGRRRRRAGDGGGEEGGSRTG